MLPSGQKPAQTENRLRITFSQLLFNVIIWLSRWLWLWACFCPLSILCHQLVTRVSSSSQWKMGLYKTLYSRNNALRFIPYVLWRNSHIRFCQCCTLVHVASICPLHSMNCYHHHRWKGYKEYCAYRLNVHITVSRQRIPFSKNVSG